MSSEPGDNRIRTGMPVDGSALAEGISQDLFYVNEREIRRRSFSHETELNRSRLLTLPGFRLSSESM